MSYMLLGHPTQEREFKAVSSLVIHGIGRSYSFSASADIFFNNKLLTLIVQTLWTIFPFGCYNRTLLVALIMQSNLLRYHGFLN